MTRAARNARALAELAFEIAAGEREPITDRMYTYKNNEDLPESIHRVVPQAVHDILCPHGPGSVQVHDEEENIVICAGCALAIELEY